MSYEKAAEIASKASYTSAGGTLVAGLTLNEWAMIVGIVATIASFGLNWYYKYKHLQLARRNINAMVEDE